MAGRRKPDASFIRRSKVDPKHKKALTGRKMGGSKDLEHVLTTIDGASTTVEIGTLMPSTSVASGRRSLFKVTRVDLEIDAVYGIEVPKCPMPWWKWNLLRRKGLVDDEMLEDFNVVTEG